jgi:hypothetical protein
VTILHINYFYLTFSCRRNIFISAATRDERKKRLKRGWIRSKKRLPCKPWQAEGAAMPPACHAFDGKKHKKRPNTIPVYGSLTNYSIKSYS